MKKKIKTVQKVKNTVFFTALAVLAVVGTLWFLRPTESAVEKRKLTEFPKFTLQGLLDGSYTRKIDTWYADTYPLREPMIRGWNGFKTLYGNQGEQLSYKGEVADPIPTGTPGKTDPPPSTGGSTDPSVTLSTDPETQPTDPPPTEPEPTYKDGTITTPGEMAGSLYVVGDQAFGLYYFGRTPADDYAKFLNHVYDVLGDKTEIYSIIAPVNSGVLLDQSILQELRTSNQKDAIDYIYSQVNDGVHKVDVFTNLKHHNAEYIYFRTDHHWTALGAYYAYQALAGEMGVAPHELSQFETMEFPGFVGSYYSSVQTQAMLDNPDTVVAYVPMGTNLMTMRTAEGEEQKWNIVNDVSSYDVGSKYYCFSGSDQPYAYAHNPQITDGSACVLVKDSYGNALVPFLIDHYEYVYWIDYRYYEGTLQGLVTEKQPDDVIICINIYNSTEPYAIKSFNRLVP